MLESDIYLRALDFKDLELIYTWRQDEVYRKGIVSSFKYTNLETEKKWLETVISNHYVGKEVRLGIVDKNSNCLVGLIYLVNINQVFKSAEIGYLIGDVSVRGRGFASKSIRLILDYGFSQLGLERVGALVLDDNIASLKSLYKVGFVKEGVKRRGAFKDGVFKDVIYLGILKEDFNEQK